MNKVYYKIYKLFFQSICVECGKKELIPKSDFFVDETEYDLVFSKLGTEEKLFLKSGWINMRYVAGIEYSHLSEKLLENKMPLISEMEELSKKLKDNEKK